MNYTLNCRNNATPNLKQVAGHDGFSAYIMSPNYQMRIFWPGYKNFAAFGYRGWLAGYRQLVGKQLGRAALGMAADTSHKSSTEAKGSSLRRLQVAVRLVITAARRQGAKTRKEQLLCFHCAFDDFVPPRGMKCFCSSRDYFTTSERNLPRGASPHLSNSSNSVIWERMCPMRTCASWMRGVESAGTQMQ
jgi:hypothetical protein